MSNSIVSQIPKNLLFRYRLTCRPFEGKGKADFDLPVGHTLAEVGQLEGQPQFADVRAAWSPEGLYFQFEISGKKQSLWCKPNQLLDSDGVQLWIDTRDTHNVHRATKFCHWFVMLPEGGGARGDKGLVSGLKINRSKDDSPMLNRRQPEITSKKTKSGYWIKAFIPGEALHGWDTADHRMLGFNFVVIDRELGRQSLAIGPELPIDEDPSLWQTLQLVD